MSYSAKQTITVSKDLLPPPFGNPHNRYGLAASSPVSLCSLHKQKVDFQCLISTSTSHTLIEKSLVDSISSLRPPFRWIGTDSKDFNPGPMFTIDEAITATCPRTPGQVSPYASFLFAEFNERERENYRFQCFIDSASFSEYTKHLKVVGKFDFCFTTEDGAHVFRIENAIVIDGELFFRPPECLSYGPKREPFRAVLGRNFFENHPHLMLESDGESGFALSPSLLHGRFPCVDIQGISFAGSLKDTLVMGVAGACLNVGPPEKHFGGYGVFLAP